MDLAMQLLVFGALFFAWGALMVVIPLWSGKEGGLWIARKYFQQSPQTRFKLPFWIPILIIVISVVLTDLMMPYPSPLVPYIPLMYMADILDRPYSYSGVPWQDLINISLPVTNFVVSFAVTLLFAWQPWTRLSTPKA